jgi:hypothetical protein
MAEMVFTSGCLFYRLVLKVSRIADERICEKAQCLIRLGRYEESLLVLQACQDSLQLAKLSEVSP